MLHEFLEGPPGASVGGTSGFYISSTREGSRSQDPGKYRKDADILERALLTEKDDFLRSRYRFYLARSYRDAGEKEKAIVNFLKRGDLGYWIEEVFMSLYNAAQLQKETGRPFEEVIATLLRASAAVPSRAEALHAASCLCREKNRFVEGYGYAQRGLAIPLPIGGLFVETWIYNYGLLDELAVNAYWSAKYAECVEACDRLLNEGKLPIEMRERILKNRTFAIEKLRETATPTSPEFEVYIKLLHGAREKEHLARPNEEVISAYLEASAACPTRAEAFHDVARFCRNKCIYERGYQFAAEGLAVGYPTDAAGAEVWIYEYGLLDELAVNAYWTGRYAECADACDRLLSEGKLPAEFRDRVRKNEEFATDKLAQDDADKLLALRAAQFQAAKQQEPSGQNQTPGIRKTVGIPQGLGNFAGTERQVLSSSGGRMKSLTLNLCTRQRPHLLGETIERTLANVTLPTTRFLINVDDDDPASYEAAMKFAPTVVVSSLPREDTLGEKFNRALKVAPADIYLTMVDYAPILTKGFDRRVMEAQTSILTVLFACMAIWRTCRSPACRLLPTSLPRRLATSTHRTSHFGSSIIGYRTSSN